MLLISQQIALRGKTRTHVLPKLMPWRVRGVSVTDLMKQNEGVGNKNLVPIVVIGNSDFEQYLKSKLSRWVAENRINLINQKYPQLLSLSQREIQEIERFFSDHLFPLNTFVTHPLMFLNNDYEILDKKYVFLFDVFTKAREEERKQGNQKSDIEKHVNEDIKSIWVNCPELVSLPLEEYLQFMNYFLYDLKFIESLDDLVLMMQQTTREQPSGTFPALRLIFEDLKFDNFVKYINVLQQEYGFTVEEIRELLAKSHYAAQIFTKTDFLTCVTLRKYILENVFNFPLEAVRKRSVHYDVGVLTCSRERLIRLLEMFVQTHNLQSVEEISKRNLFYYQAGLVTSSELYLSLIPLKYEVFHRYLTNDVEFGRNDDSERASRMVKSFLSNFPVDESEVIERYNIGHAIEVLQRNAKGNRILGRPQAQRKYQSSFAEYEIVNNYFIIKNQDLVSNTNCSRTSGNSTERSHRPFSDQEIKTIREKYRRYVDGIIASNQAILTELMEEMDPVFSSQLLEATSSKKEGGFSLNDFYYELWKANENLKLSKEEVEARMGSTKFHSYPLPFDRIGLLIAGLGLSSTEMEELLRGFLRWDILAALSFHQCLLAIPIDDRLGTYTFPSFAKRLLIMIRAVKQSIQDKDDHNDDTARSPSKPATDASGVTTLSEYVEAYRAHEVRRIVAALVMKAPSRLAQSERVIEDHFCGTSLEAILARKRRGSSLQKIEDEDQQDKGRGTGGIENPWSDSTASFPL